METSQANIWSHFQNEDPGIFRGAHPRLEYLVRTAGQLTGLARPVLLNIGIGDGHLERTAQSRGWFVHSLDPDADAVARLSAQSIDAKTGLIEQMPFPDAHFDCVVASEVLEHLSDEQRRQGMREIHRTLKPGGYLIGTVPYREILAEQVAVCPQCRHVFHRWGHTTSFDMPSMRRVLSPPFKNVRMKSTVFVDFRGHSLRVKVKHALRIVLARLGISAAVPSILFTAQKP